MTLNWPFLLFPAQFRHEIFYSLPSDKVSFMREHNYSSFRDEEWDGYAIIILNFCNRNLWTVIICINVSW